MLVTSLNEMEQIVSYRPDLEWDGWNVVHYKKNDAAQFTVDGAFKNGQWYKKNIFQITENGWSIPNYMGLRDDI